MSAVLIDTNVLLYAYDAADAARSDHALRVLRHLQETLAGRLSVQCLAEFFSVATRKLKPPLLPKPWNKLISGQAHFLFLT